MSSDVARGTALAAIAAIAFGVTAPLVARAGEGVGAFATAALLYLGAALAALVLGGRPVREGRATPRLGVLAGMVLAGAVLAPTAFAWGLARTGATTGSLLLNLEAAFTVLLAAVVLREYIGRRVVVALVFIGAGGVLVALDARSAEATAEPLGALAIAFAAAAWGLDNVLARKLESLDAIDVVFAKGLLGGATSATVGLALDEPWPSPAAAAALLAAGGLGYGVSLRLYLAAQRRMGAARTGSVFAVAPFVGAGVSLLVGGRTAGALTGLAAVMFAVGVVLHATEPVKDTAR